ncbi:hypothetical protein E4O05_08585 [Treponema sp. OMZ 787]|uniref:GNAT family N-acetyltransferase n=1 Tax=Treponema sp. OMZ 787 TaxID=2563669 RepID=UPI0020A3A585|nr:GNAT family N-acetyltransferase [Treponema sp. OMZ 787]UTC61610.1 hypothetical protein E4O05_08585 [Treponema sp. OMZ 787]
MFNPNIQFDVPEDHVVIGDGPASPFYLDGWLKWNEVMWNVKSERVLYTDGKSEYPRLEGVLYTDKKGRVVMPPRNPHLPFRFVSTNTSKHNKLYLQYLDIMNLFIIDLKHRGVFGNICLPPGFIDARLFQWNCYDVGVKYTFMIELPYDTDVMDKKIRNKIKKASALGYTIEETCNWRDVYECLKFTEEFKGFSHMTNQDSILLCSKYLGSDNIVGHVVYSKKNEPIAGGIRLICKNGIAYGWSQGASREHLLNGVNQFLYVKILDDLYKRGAKYFDWGGANISNVALAKSSWGMPLVPYLTIRPKNLRYLGSVCKSYLKAKILRK